MSRAAIATLLVFGILILPACSSGSGSVAAPLGGIQPSGASAPSETSPLAPGRTAKRGGRVEVVGTLQRDDSGTWLIVGAVPEQASDGRVIGTIVNSSSLSHVDLPSLENSYVRVTGTAAAGIATDKSGLGVIADTVTKVSVK